MNRPTLIAAAHLAALDADAALQRALTRLSTAALDARDGAPGGGAELQRALRRLERTTVARRRAAAVVHKLEAVTAALAARNVA